MPEPLRPYQWTRSDAGKVHMHVVLRHVMMNTGRVATTGRSQGDQPELRVERSDSGVSLHMETAYAVPCLLAGVLVTGLSGALAPRQDR
jgi:hypothetical protein